MTIHMKKNLQTNYPSADSYFYEFVVLFKGIDELRVASEPITSLEMLLFRACHVNIASPDVLIKSILENGTDSKMHVYNLERKSSLKTKKNEIVTPRSKTKNTELDKLEETADNCCERNLGYFSRAIVKK